MIKASGCVVDLTNQRNNCSLTSSEWSGGDVDKPMFPGERGREVMSMRRESAHCGHLHSILNIVH